jgi:hypothetical protein
MENFNISGEGRYVQMFGRVIDTYTNISTDMESPNPIFVCEMFKNQFTRAHRENLFESTDLFKKMKELIYPMMGDNSEYIMEYEVRYGNKLIFESEDKLRTEQLISESWDFVKNKIYEQCPIIIEGFGDWLSDKASAAWDGIKSGVGYVADKAVAGAKYLGGKAIEGAKWVGGKIADGASWAWDKMKEAGQWILNKGLPWFFEKLEDFLISPVGIALDVALTAVGVGKVATGILWGAILIWKIYQIFNGTLDAGSIWTWIDVAVCLVGIVFSGAAKGLRAAFKAVGGNVAKVGAKVLGPVFKVISKGASGIMNLMIKPIEWLASIFGSGAQKYVATFKSKFTGIFTKMEGIFTKAAGKQTQSIGGVVKQGIKNDIINPAKAALKGQAPVSLGKAALKGTTAGLAFYGGNELLKGGINQYAQHKQRQGAEEMAKMAQAIPDETLQQGIEADPELNDAIAQMQQTA